jgi:hypothetical protein
VSSLICPSASAAVLLRRENSAPTGTGRDGQSSTARRDYRMEQCRWVPCGPTVVTVQRSLIPSHRAGHRRSHAGLAEGGRWFHRLPVGASGNVAAVILRCLEPTDSGGYTVASDRGCRTFHIFCDVRRCGRWRMGVVDVVLVKTRPCNVACSMSEVGGANLEVDRRGTRWSLGQRPL